MAKQETNIFKLSLVALSELGSRIFRINTGSAWAGNKIIKLPASHKTWPGAIVILDPRRFSTGTPPGYSDGTGWTPIVITPEMVGEQIAVFTAVETKTRIGKKATDDQQNFINQIIQTGGIAGVARSPEEAVQIVRGFKTKHGIE